MKVSTKLDPNNLHELPNDLANGAPLEELPESEPTTPAKGARLCSISGRNLGTILLVMTCFSYDPCLVFFLSIDLLAFFCKDLLFPVTKLTPKLQCSKLIPNGGRGELWLMIYWFIF